MKSLYNGTLICTYWLYCSQYSFFITAGFTVFLTIKPYPAYQNVIKNFAATMNTFIKRVGYTRLISVDFALKGPVIQSILSLMSLLSGQLGKCFTTLLPNTMIYFVEKIERSFCSAKASHIFSTINIGLFQILTFEILTKR